MILSGFVFRRRCGLGLMLATMLGGGLLPAIASPRVEAIAAPGDAPSPASPAAAASAAAPMHPDRLLRCDMRRVTNVDTGKVQDYSELKFEGSHPLVLHLGPIVVRTGLPPEAFETPESTSALTRIESDPDNLLADVPKQFSRVVDRWPERVEIATDVDGKQIHVMIVTPLDAAQQKFRLFMTFSSYSLGYNLARVYLGDCSATITAP